MNNKFILAVLIVLFVIGGVFFMRMNQSGYDSSVGGAANQEGASANTFQDDEFDDDVDDSDEEDSDEREDDDSGSVVNVEVPSEGLVPVSELSKHNTQEDCWVAYDGKVYDLTSFLPNHPGSAGAIAPHCGTSDGFTTAFERKHGKSKVSNLMRVGVLMGDFDVMGEIR